MSQLPRAKNESPPLLWIPKRTSLGARTHPPLSQHVLPVDADPLRPRVSICRSTRTERRYGKVHVLTTVASVAELEASLIYERTNVALKAAKARGEVRPS